MKLSMKATKARTTKMPLPPCPGQGELRCGASQGKAWCFIPAGRVKWLAVRVRDGGDMSQDRTR